VQKEFGSFFMRPKATKGTQGVTKAAQGQKNGGVPPRGPWHSTKSFVALHQTAGGTCRHRHPHSVRIHDEGGSQRYRKQWKSPSKADFNTL